MKTYSILSFFVLIFPLSLWAQERGTVYLADNSSGRDEFSQVLAQYRAALHIDSLITWAYLGAGGCYLQLGDNDSAAFCCRKAIGSGTMEAGHWIQVGTLYEAAGYIEDAAMSFRRCVDLFPDSIAGYLRYASLLKRIEKYDSAMYYLEKAKELDSSNYFVFMEQAEIQLFLENYLEAEKDADRALELDSTHAESWALMADVCVNLGEYPRALYAIEKAVALSPDNFLYRRNKAYLLVEIDRTDQALQEALELSYHLPDDPAVSYLLALCHFNKGNYDACIEIAHSGFHNEQLSPYFYSLAARALTYKCDYKAADTYFALATQAVPLDLDIYKFQVDARLFSLTPAEQLDFQNNVPAFSRINLRSLSKLCPQVSQKVSRYYYPRLIRKFRSDYQALGLDQYFMLYYGFSLTRKYRRNANSTVGSLDYFDDLIAGGQYKEAIAFGERLLSKNPTLIRVYSKIGVACLMIGEVDKAREYIYKSRAFYLGILASGRGLTMEDAYIVVNLSDPFDIVQYMNCQIEKHNVVAAKGHYFNRFSCLKPDGSISNLYFCMDRIIVY